MRSQEAVLKTTFAAGLVLAAITLAQAASCPQFGAPGIYQVKEGDTLESVAAERLGDGERWRELYRLNQKRVGRAGELRPGALIVVP